jgi:aromatic-L-amino-acid/L-tryptophan decarboxylase
VTIEPGPETGHLADHLGRIGAALDGFLTTPRPDPVTRIAEWDEPLGGPLPRTGIGAAGVMDELTRVLIPNGSRFSDPGFWGFITAGPTTMPTVASTAAAIASPQRYTITAFNRVEELSLDWLAELCQLPPAMKGVYVSGGSVANLVALGAARQWALESAGLDPAADGLDGRPVAIYASSEVHHTVQRAAAVLGLGRQAVVEVATDTRQRLDPAALAAALQDGQRAGRLPLAVVATAGTTNTGAIDPLRDAGELARSHGAWFHIDGAYGLVGILDERVAAAYDGLELADSVIVDPHKWLGAPVGVAAAFVRDRSILHRAFTQGPADYLEGSFVQDADVRSSLDTMGVPYADLALELSSPARGVTVWAILRELGRDGVRARIVADNDLARRVARLAEEHPRLEALTQPQLSIACLRYVGGDGDPDEVNERLLRRLRRESPYLPSATVVRGRFAIRPCFINARTTPDQVDAFVATLVRFGDEHRRDGR